MLSHSFVTYINTTNNKNSPFSSATLHSFTTTKYPSFDFVEIYAQQLHPIFLQQQQQQEKTDPNHGRTS